MFGSDRKSLAEDVWKMARGKTPTNMAPLRKKR